MPAPRWGSRTLGDLAPITVAVPTCNGARHLADALRGILPQEGPSFDLLIVDDRSDDETVALAGSVAGDRARVVVNTERLGLAGNWNQCVALSRTPLIAIFHQDDRMRPGHLAAQVRAFEADRRTGLVCGAATVIDEAGRPVPRTVVEPGGIDSPDRVFPPSEFVRWLAVSNPLRCSAVSLRVEAHAAAGGFDPGLRYVVDWDFWIRVARTWAVAWLARPTVEVRWHRESETHRFRSGTADLEEIARLQTALFSREGQEWADLGRLRRAASRRLARAYLNRAHHLLRGGEPGPARSCLARAVALSPPIVGTLARDPRLALQMAALTAWPRRAGLWFSRAPDAALPATPTPPQSDR